VDPVADVGHAAGEVVGFFGEMLTRTSFTGWLVLLAGIFLGLAAGRIAKAMLRGVADRLKKRGWTVRGSVFEHAAAPASLALVTFGLTIGLSQIYLREDVRLFTLKAIALLYIVAIGWFLYNLVELLDIALRRVTGRTATRLDDTVVILLRKTLRIFVLIMFVLFVAENIFGADITAWLAGLGIAGLAVSLAAQDSLKNLFGSVTVLIERPFAIGDRIVFSGYDGIVEAVGFRSTRIRTLNGHLVTLPNMKFTDGHIENISARPWVSRSFTIAVTYDTPPDKVAEAVEAISAVLASPEIAPSLAVPDRPPRVTFSEFGSDGLNIAVIYWYALNTTDESGAVRDWPAYQRINEKVNLGIMKALAEVGVEMAFTTRTVYLAGDAKRELSLRLLQTDDRDDG
jgi:MscS family membrane protein